MSLDIGASKTLALFTERERPKARFINDIHGVILSTHKPSMCDPIAIILAMCPEDILFLYEGYADVELNG